MSEIIVKIEIVEEPVNIAIAATEVGGGAGTYAGLTDAATADLPAINGPLGTALAGKSPVSGISPSAIAGTAVIATDPRLSDARPPTTHAHVSADISDAATAATPGTLVLRNGSGGAAFAGLTLSGTGGSPFTSTLTGGVSFENRTLVLPDASGTLVIDSQLANSASISASVLVAGDTLPLRDSLGRIYVSDYDVTGATAYGSSASWTYAYGADAAHRTALGSGAGVGDALFTATSAAEAREIALNEILKYAANAGTPQTNPGAYLSDDVLTGVNLTAGLWEISWYYAFDQGACGSISRLVFGTPASVGAVNSQIYGGYYRGNQGIASATYVTSTGSVNLGNNSGALTNWHITGFLTLNITGNTTLGMQFIRAADSAGATITRRAGAYLRARRING